jgi:hypothetical protein
MRRSSITRSLDCTVTFGDTATFTATVVIRANAPYRIVARGDAGLTTFELTYRALTDDDTPSAPPVVFEAMPDVLRPSSR